MSKSFLFTSESVSAGHPDKMADQISDAILDTHLLSDKNARVACEVMVKDNVVVLGGEITSAAKDVNYEKIVKNVIKDIGYTSEIDHSLSFDNIKVINLLGQQSREINDGVDRKDGLLGAGDQGLMFGYATNENDAYMPTPIYLAHTLASELKDLRKSIPLLSPDVKTQVTVKYEQKPLSGSLALDKLKPIAVDSVVISSQHSSDLSLDDLRVILMDHLTSNSVLGKLYDLSHLKIGENLHLNPAGSFTIGGPVGDCGLTGRKIIVDTYGGFGRHGGGAFSGKDPSKVDRSAAYMARYLAKTIVWNELADRCEIQLSYAIGHPQPVSIFVETFNTNKVSNESILSFIKANFDLSPQGIIDHLDLLNQSYYPTASYGHFGNPNDVKGSFSWERPKVNF